MGKLGGRREKPCRKMVLTEKGHDEIRSAFNINWCGFTTLTPVMRDHWTSESGLMRQVVFHHRYKCIEM